MADDTSQPRKWADLVVAEPRLAHLENDAQRVKMAPNFCAMNAWYGRHGFKQALSYFVGWSRRSHEWRSPIPVGVVVSGHELLERADHDQAAKVAVLAEDIANGRDHLWTSEAYDVAYRHLLDVLGDCDEGGDCPCWA